MSRRWDYLTGGENMRFLLAAACKTYGIKPWEWEHIAWQWQLTLIEGLYSLGILEGDPPEFFEGQGGDSGEVDPFEAFMRGPR